MVLRDKFDAWRASGNALENPIKRHSRFFALISIATLWIGPCALCDRAIAGPRVALVLAAEDYTELNRSGVGASRGIEIADALKAKGFEVIVSANPSNSKARAALRDFFGKVTGAEIALIVVSGHGIASAGQTFFLPVNAHIERATDLFSNALSVSNLALIAGYAKNGGVCFLMTLPSIASTVEGAQPRPQFQTEVDFKASVAFSTSTMLANAGADEAAQRAAAAVASVSAQPHSDFKQLMEACADGQGGRLFGTPRSVELAAPPPPLPPRPVPAQPQLSEAALEWDHVKDSQSIAALEGFKARFKGDPVYGPLVEERLAILIGPKDPSPQGDPIPPAGPAGCKGAQVKVGSEAKCLKFGDGFQDADIAPPMVVVPPGQFLMGSSTSEIANLKKENPNDSETFDREGPQSLVHMAKAFAVGRSHVTKGQFAAFVAASGYKIESGCRMWSGEEWTFHADYDWKSPGYVQTDDYPVVCVTYLDAKAYVDWLSRETGANYGLLSEAQAEYATRATTEATPQPAYSFGDEEKDVCANGNTADLSGKAKFPGWKDFGNCTDGWVFTAPVGSFKPNRFGLYDVHGNVWTWTADCWSATNAGSADDGSARTNGDCSRRPVRGGSWNLDPHDARSASRYWNSLDFRGNHLGFRVMRVISP